MMDLLPYHLFLACDRAVDQFPEFWRDIFCEVPEFWQEPVDHLPELRQDDAKQFPEEEQGKQKKDKKRRIEPPGCFAETMYHEEHCSGKSLRGISVLSHFLKYYLNVLLSLPLPFRRRTNRRTPVFLIRVEQSVSLFHKDYILVKNLSKAFPIYTYNFSFPLCTREYQEKGKEDARNRLEEP